MEFLQAIDEGALYWFENHHFPWLTPIMKGLTYLGESNVILTLTIGTAIGCFVAKMPRTAAIVLMTALLAYLLGYTVKRLVDRPRPDVAWRLIRLPKDKSFPSGHALNTMADFGAVGLITSRRLKHRAMRRLVIGLGLVLPLLIGLSRIYLGVHYPSDVIGGWTAGLACALLAYWADIRWGKRRVILLPETISPLPDSFHSPRADSERIASGGEATDFKAPI